MQRLSSAEIIKNIKTRLDEAVSSTFKFSVSGDRRIIIIDKSNPLSDAEKKAHAKKAQKIYEDYYADKSVGGGFTGKGGHTVLSPHTIAMRHLDELSAKINRAKEVLSMQSHGSKQHNEAQKQLEKLEQEYSKHAEYYQERKDKVDSTVANLRHLAEDWHYETKVQTSEYRKNPDAFYQKYPCHPEEKNKLDKLIGASVSDRDLQAYGDKADITLGKLDSVIQR